MPTMPEKGQQAPDFEGPTQTGEAFRRRAGISSVRFVRGNVFRPPVAPGSAVS